VRSTWIRSLLRVGSTAIALSVAAGCVNVFWKTEPRDVTLSGDSSTTIRSPLKAHLQSGGTVVFPNGGVVSRSHVSGMARRFAFMANVPSAPDAIASVPLDSIVGIEAFDGRVVEGATVAVSAAATVTGLFSTALLAKALFGSCPTLYADTGRHAVLQAEGFSYAIGPLFRQRDVDPLVVRPNGTGVVRLELRNEALETHFIDHLELSRVTHGRSEIVVPDQRGGLVAVSAIHPPVRAIDREGRDVRDVLRDADERVFSTAPARLAAAHAGDLDDWIDIESADLGTGDSLIVLLRLRNSLLNTVLLYDGMLSGPAALDWLGSDLRQPASALTLARWYAGTMGLRAIVDGVPVPSGVSTRTAHAQLGDIGPLAFREVALVLPRSPTDGVRARIRLRFVADNWRIDQLRIGTSLRRPHATVMPVMDVRVPTALGGLADDTAAVRALRDPDQRPLQTQAGQRMMLEFSDTRPVPPDSAVRYLVTWQGWYSEWIRPAWILAGASDRARSEPFVPGDSAVATALSRWRSRKAAFERQFYESRLPTR